MRGFEARGGSQHERVIQVAADNLEPDRQALLRESGGHGHRRLSRQVEREREGRPFDQWYRPAIDLRGTADVQRKGRYRARRCDAAGQTGA